MPGFDRTGPWGYGPRTGRGLGYCSGYFPAGRSRGPWGFGRGWGFGGRRDASFGWGFSWPARTESLFLKDLAEDLRAELNLVEKRLDELEKEKTEE